MTDIDTIKDLLGSTAKTLSGYTDAVIDATVTVVVAYLQSQPQGSTERLTPAIGFTYEPEDDYDDGYQD